MKTLISRMWLLLVVVLPTQVLAQSKDSTFDISKLYKPCVTAPTDEALNPKGECFLYVKGFLLGAVTSDKVMLKEATKGQNFSEFGSRAYQTRVGITRDGVPPRISKKFCLQDAQVSEDLVVELITKVREDYVEDKTNFGNSLYSLLRQLHPCENRA